jgi:cytoplasmic iron level regulating protein YaaA (DUF328/UPF0246 family)
MAPTSFSSGGPLILLSPAKSLSFDGKLTSTLAAIKPTAPRFLAQASTLSSALAKMSKPQLKSLMGLSDSLAALNHARYADFAAQPSRAAVCAFEGQAYKGLDAKSLTAEDLAYCQSHLRILCGLYGVLRPYDEIRPYRLEMSNRLSCDGHANLYEYWSAQSPSLTASLADEKPSWVLNVASQEYAKSVEFSGLGVPVVTASFPGPAVYAKTARGEMVRFCAERRVTKPEQLKEFTGGKGEWSYLPGESDDSTLVFKRGAPSGGGKAKAATATTAGKKRAADDDDGVGAEEEGGASSAKSQSKGGRRPRKA